MDQVSEFDRSRRLNLTGIARRAYLITHAHMDHINSMVICAGSIPGGPRRVFAVHDTLLDIQDVFSGRLWPNLGTWDEGAQDMFYIYTE